MYPLLDNTAARRWSSMGATAAVLLLLASACGGGQEGSTDPPSADAGSIGPDTVAIRVDHTGGFVPATQIPSRVPLVSVYGDGRVITEGPVPAIYPGPALPNVQQQKIPPGDVAALVRKALDAGVGSGADFGRPSVTDLPDTRFTVTTGEEVKRAEVYALEIVEEGPNAALTDAQRAARKKLTALMDELRDLPTALGESESYPVSSLAAIASAYPEQNPPDVPAPTPVTWPGPPLPGEPVGSGGRIGCVTMTGDAAKAVLAAAANANAATPWTSDGKAWSVRLRPLLPDESGCADLSAQR
jgi:hypothetical protein